MIKKYRQKNDVKAVFFNRDEKNIKDLTKLLGKDLIFFKTEKHIGGQCYAETKQGKLIENLYVVKDKNGMYFQCEKEWFEKNFEEVKK